MRIGIRREDKSPWEARIPVVPSHFEGLRREGIEIEVQPSQQRIYTDDELRAAGARVTEDLSGCGVIFGVKEIPTHLFEPDKTYVFFSHTIKGQAYNMPMLRRMMELGCSLIDYERIVDDEGRRLVSFSRFAGMAGMIDSLWAYGQRLGLEGRLTPLARFRQALTYDSLRDAQNHLKEIAQEFRAEMNRSSQGLTIALTGMGRVARGALEVARYLEPNLLVPSELGRSSSGPGFHLVLFDVPDLVERVEGGEVDTEEYRAHPERYRGVFARALPYIDLLVNGIYWEDRYPRLVTEADIQSLWSAQEPRLKVIGDISCDIRGSIEVTLQACDPGQPTFVYEVETGAARVGFEGRGPVVMATDILPTELPREASYAFSEALVDLVKALAAADPRGPLESWNLPPELERAVILHQGRLTPEYMYLNDHLHRDQLSP